MLIQYWPTLPSPPAPTGFPIWGPLVLTSTQIDAYFGAFWRWGFPRLDVLFNPHRLLDDPIITCETLGPPLPAPIVRLEPTQEPAIPNLPGGFPTPDRVVLQSHWEGDTLVETTYEWEDSDAPWPEWYKYWDQIDVYEWHVDEDGDGSWVLTECVIPRVDMQQEGKADCWDAPPAGIDPAYAGLDADEPEDEKRTDSERSVPGLDVDHHGTEFEQEPDNDSNDACPDEEAMGMPPPGPGEDYPSLHSDGGVPLGGY